VSYAVVWSENGKRPCAGEVEIGGGRILLAGASADGISRRVLSLRDLAKVWVERRPSGRLLGLPTLVVEALDGGRIELTSMGAAGSLLELAARIDASR